MSQEHEIVTATPVDDDTQDTLDVTLSFGNCAAIAYALNIASAIEVDATMGKEFRDAAQVLMTAIDEQKLQGA